MKLPGGLFISFEGPDKAGKSTQISRLASYLSGLGYIVTVTREPGGTPVCEAIRHLVMHKGEEALAPEAELLLFSASRAQLVQSIIRPNLDRGNIVLCDRFADSTVAYQGEARGLDLSLIDRLNRLAVGDCWPKLTFLLDLPVEESLRRLNLMEGRPKNEEDDGIDDRFEQEDRFFRLAVREGFLKLAAREPQRIRKLDACESVDELAAQIKAEVDHVIAEIS